jgi:hypothetical protein
MPTLISEQSCGNKLLYCNSWGCDRFVNKLSTEQTFRLINNQELVSEAKANQTLGRNTTGESDRSPNLTDFGKPYYYFVPTLYLDRDDAIVKNTDGHVHVYCYSCMHSELDEPKNKNGKVQNRPKRICGCWEKDDHGYMEHACCNFCGTRSTVQIKTAHFTTNCYYQGVRDDGRIVILVCNKCTKMNPKQVYKFNA